MEKLRLAVMCSIKVSRSTKERNRETSALSSKAISALPVYFARIDGNPDETRDKTEERKKKYRENY